MPSSFTQRNRLTKQATGENTNTWGLILNAVLDLIDFMSDGVISLSASTVLTTENGAADQARARFLNITATATITIPSVEKWYLVRSVGTATITNGSNSVTVYPGETTIVLTDGAAMWKLVPSDVPDPTRPTAVANKRYADNLAFQANAGILPGQGAGIVGFLKTVDGTPGWEDVTKADVGLSEVDNTSDEDKPISDATGAALALKGDATDNIVTITGTTHTIDIANLGKVHRFTNASGCVVTMPSNFPEGWNLIWAQIGAGQITWNPASGATRRNRLSHTKSAGQYAEGVLRVDQNSDGVSAIWFLNGDTAT